MVGEEPVRLVTSVVLGAETPVNEREDWLLIEINCAEDAAAYSIFPSTASVRVVKNEVYTPLVHF